MLSADVVGISSKASLIVTAGAFLTGVGGIALSTGWISIGGIATALGAVAIYRAGAVASRADVAAIQKKLDDFLTRLQHMREEQFPTPPRLGSSGDNIAKIDEDFTAWANEFAENHYFRRLQFTQTKLGRQAIAAEMTTKWRPLLRRIFDLLINTIAAYNERLGCAIQANLPGVPDDLFANPYRGSVTFGANAVWTLQTETTHPPRPSSRLTLWIYFEKGASSLSTAAASIMVDIQANEFEMFAHGAAVPVDIDLVGTPLAEFDERVAKVIRQLVEAQLMEQTGE